MIYYNKENSKYSLTDALLKGDGMSLYTGNGEVVKFRHDDSLALLWQKPKPKNKRLKAREINRQKNWLLQKLSNRSMVLLYVIIKK